MLGIKPFRKSVHKQAPMLGIDRNKIISLKSAPKSFEETLEMYLPLPLPYSSYLHIKFHLFSISSSLVQVFIIFHQVCFHNFLTNFLTCSFSSSQPPLPTTLTHSQEAGRGCVRSSSPSCNLFKTYILWMTPPGTKITVLIFQDALQILAICSKLDFQLCLLNTPSPSHNYLCDLPCCPQPRALFKLVCLECPLLHVHSEALLLNSSSACWSHLCEHSRHLFLVAVSACIKGTRDQTHSPGSSLTSL